MPERYRIVVALLMTALFVAGAFTVDVLTHQAAPRVALANPRQALGQPALVATPPPISDEASND